MNGPADIPLGDLQLHDYYEPGLAAGNWWIEVEQSLADGENVIAPEPLRRQQEVVVSAPQFSIDPAEVLTVYPPPNTRGEYANVLPHVVLAQPLLPWERQLSGGGDGPVPWLALLIVSAEEIVGAEDSPTRTTSATIADFLALDGSVLASKTQPSEEVSTASPCSYVQLGSKTFAAIVPRLDELRYLSHCRQANAGDKAIAGLDQDGLVSVAVANRFPKAASAATPAKSYAYLVSLLGLEAWLGEGPDLGSYETVALVTLYSWSFETLPRQAEDFAGRMKAIVASETQPGKLEAADLWLRLPPPASAPAAGEDAAGAEVARRLEAGFVPLAYSTRSAERTVAWYRGPLIPVAPAAPQLPEPFPTADAALVYVPDFGVFDVSLAGAWNAGRAAALADRSFGKWMLDLRRRANRVTDALLQRLTSTGFSQTTIAALEDSSIHDELVSLLDAELLAAASASAGPAPSGAEARVAASDPDPKATIQAFLAEPAAKQAVLEAVEADLDPIATWLARLLLLYPIPFHCLVADERMLPVEALRFFNVDPSWLGAMLDGACSIGMESSRATFYGRMMNGVLQDAAWQAAQVYRDGLLGRAPTTVSPPEKTMSGLLLRSGVVAGWPTLAVRPRDGDGKLLPILRMDHLSPNVLLCLFAGVPASVELSEPQDSFRFGVDDDGLVPPRSLAAADLGAQIAGAAEIQVYDAATSKSPFGRAADPRTLRLEPGSPGGLVQTLAAATKQSSIGPADFAIEMVKTPESAHFEPPAPAFLDGDGRP